MSQQQYQGACHCGDTRITIELTQSAAHYSPRACDSDFCRMHGSAYISEHNGRLVIRIQEPDLLGRY